MNIDDDEDRVFIVENNKIADFVPTPWITVEPKYWINVKIETLLNNYDDLLNCLINNKDDASTKNLSNLDTFWNLFLGLEMDLMNKW